MTGPIGQRGVKRNRGEPGVKGMPGPPGRPGKSIPAPQVMLSPAEQTRNEGTNANFYCTASGNPPGNPPPRIKWRFKDRKLISGSKHLVTYDGALIIKRLNYSEAGQYTCVATNVPGSHEGS